METPVPARAGELGPRGGRASLERWAQPLRKCLSPIYQALPVVQSHRAMLPQDHPPPTWPRPTGHAL